MSRAVLMVYSVGQGFGRGACARRGSRVVAHADAVYPFEVAALRDVARVCIRRGIEPVPPALPRRPTEADRVRRDRTLEAIAEARRDLAKGR